MSGTWREVGVTDAVKGFRLRSRPTLADPNVVSVPEAAELLGISKDLAYDLARRGELPGAFQLGCRPPSSMSTKATRSMSIPS